MRSRGFYEHSYIRGKPMKYKRLIDVVIYQNEAILYFKNGTQTTTVTIPLIEAVKLNKHLTEIL